MTPDLVASVSGAPLSVAVVVLLLLLLQLQQYFMFQAFKRRVSESEEKLRKDRARGRWEGILRRIEMRTHVRRMSKLAASVTGKLAAVRRMQADLRGLWKEVETLQSEHAATRETQSDRVGMTPASWHCTNRGSDQDAGAPEALPAPLTKSRSWKSMPSLPSIARFSGPKHAVSRRMARSSSHDSMTDQSYLPKVYVSIAANTSTRPRESTCRRVPTSLEVVRHVSDPTSLRSPIGTTLRQIKTAGAGVTSASMRLVPYSRDDGRQGRARDRRDDAGASKVRPVAVSSGTRFYCNIVETTMAKTRNPKD